jgi:hypothetical protein
MLFKPIHLRLINLIGIITGIVIYRLTRHYSNVSAILQNSQSSLDKSRFLRLVACGFLLLAIYLPSSVYTTYLNLNSGLNPYSWSTVHSSFDWGIVPFVETNGVVQLDAWISVIAAFFLFALFGLGKDSVEFYAMCVPEFVKRALTTVCAFSKKRRQTQDEEFSRRESASTNGEKKSDERSSWKESLGTWRGRLSKRSFGLQSDIETSV